MQNTNNHMVKGFEDVKPMVFAGILSFIVFTESSTGLVSVVDS
jgi:translation elongation factor EF-4